MDSNDFDDQDSSAITTTNKKRPKKRSIVNKLATNINKTRPLYEQDDEFEEKNSHNYENNRHENGRSNWKNDDRKSDSFGRNSSLGKNSLSRSSFTNGNELGYENGLSRHPYDRSVAGMNNQNTLNYNNNNNNSFEDEMERETRSFRKNSSIKNNFNSSLEKLSIENLERNFNNGYNETKFTKHFVESSPKDMKSSKSLHSKSATDIANKSNLPRNNSTRMNYDDDFIFQSARDRRNLLSPDYTLHSDRRPSQFNRSIPNMTKSENFAPARNSLHTPPEKSVLANSRSKNFNNSFTFHGDDPSLGQNHKLSFSSSVLTAVPTEKIRNRSYLVGSTNTGLLGSEELIRYFPNKRIRIHVCTWNVAEMKTIPINVDNLLLPKISEVLFDMYVISTQETAFDRQEWSIKLQETLGPHFVMYCQASHGTLNIVIFIRRDLIWFLSAPEESTVTTRVGPSSIKTKGAVAVSFILFGSPMVFINSHFKAHEGKHEDRVEDYKKIVTNLYFPKTVAQKQVKNNEPVDSTSLFDHVFWVGDLNSRMEIERTKLGGAMASGELGLDQIEKLLEVDELKRIMSEQLAFKDFSEARIKFLPTYKFDIGTDNYDTSNKNRVPSYTDRILYRCKKKSTISCLHYDSVGTFMQSDHKPVYGVYEAELRPGLDDVMFSGGQFNRQIWIEGIKRRAAQQLVKQRIMEKSGVCSVM